MSSSTTNIINPNTPGLDPMIASGQRTTTRASSFAASLPAGAVIGQLVDPFGGGAVYSTVGTVPPQLALSGSTIVKGSAAAVEGAEYRIRILATSSDGLRDVSTILSFTARVLSGSPAPVALSISGTPSAAMVGNADTFTPTIAGGTPLQPVGRQRCPARRALDRRACRDRLVHRCRIVLLHAPGNRQ
ncbi:hypothetical protein ACVOMT_11740 [Sphingomonas panni]